MLGSVLRGGLIGENITRSRFSQALSLLCERNNLTLDFTPFETARLSGFDLATHITKLRQLGFCGVSLTHPWKIQGDPLSDIRNGYPASLGASNLLRFGQDITESFNTDYSGMLAAWRAKFGDTCPGRVALAGAGGVARAIAGAMMELGADRISIWDQMPGRAVSLARDLDPTGTTLVAVAINDAPKATIDANGLINATPLGMREYPGTSVPQDWWGPKSDWVFDAVYTPIETQFMAAARQGGLARLSGFDLFRHMAVRSFSAYTGSQVDPEAAQLLLPLARGV